MKVYSKSELQEAAKAHFKKLGVKKLYASSDGQFFILENRANLHAGNKLNVYKIEDDSPVEETASEKAKQLTIKELTEKVAEIEDLTVLQSMLHEEVTGTNRSGAVKVLEDRITKLAE